MSFAQSVMDRLPAGMTLPDVFVHAFDWCEAQGYGAVFRNHDPADFTNHYLSIYPDDQRDQPGASYVLFRFEAGPPIHAPTDAVKARCVSLVKAAGDGGTIGLWLDDDGATQIVVFNHGSPYVLTSDPVVALQFLALGYPEPAALDDPTLTPESILGEPPILPTTFRGMVTALTGQALPETAAALGITIPRPDDPRNPVQQWLDR